MLAESEQLQHILPIVAIMVKPNLPIVDKEDTNILHVQRPMIVVVVDCAMLVNTISNSPNANDDRTFAHEHHHPNLDSRKVNKNSEKDKKKLNNTSILNYTMNIYSNLKIKEKKKRKKNIINKNLPNQNVSSILSSSNPKKHHEFQLLVLFPAIVINHRPKYEELIFQDGAVHGP